MTVGFHNVKRAVVLRDNWYSHRWYDAYGHGVVKYLQDFAALKSDDTTGDATEWMVTITEAGGGGDSTHAVTDLAGGGLLITTDNQAVDGVNMQLGAVAGECIDLSGSNPLYFGTEFAINDADQTAFFAGVGVTDVDWLGGLTDGMYFRSVDESAVLNFVTEQNSVENVTAVATLVDNTYVRAEFLYYPYADTGDQVRVFIDGTEVSAARTLATAATFPDDELLRLTVAFTTGEAVANTCTMRFLRMIHIYC
jgi:hypothetical protein